MRKLLRLAFESDDANVVENDEGVKIKIVGPLADVYQKALMEVYSKDDNRRAATETIQQDHAIANNVIQDIIEAVSDCSDEVTIQIVNTDELESNDAIALTGEVASKEICERPKIIVAMTESEDTGSFKNKGYTLESLSQTLKGLGCKTIGF